MMLQLQPNRQRTPDGDIRAELRESSIDESDHLHETA
jgi:hypothetical protein